MTILDTPHITSAGITSAGIDFAPLSATEWRISDSRFPKDSIQALLGFVAVHDGVYFVTRMNHPLESTQFASLEAVGTFLAGDRAESA